MLSRIAVPALVGVALGLMGAGQVVLAADMAASRPGPGDPHPTAEMQPGTYQALLARARSGESVAVIASLILPGTPFRAEGLLSTDDVRRQKARITQVGNQVMAELAGTAYRLAHQYESIPALALRVDGEALEALRKSRHVRSIREDLPARPALEGGARLHRAMPGP